MIEMIAVVVMLRSKENNSHVPYDNDIISYGEKRDHTIIIGQCLASWVGKILVM